MDGVFTAMLPRLARISIQQSFEGKREIPPVPVPLKSFAAGVFVTLYSKSRRLRGCVGTISAACSNIWEETYANARKSAFADSRFSPVTSEELPDLSIEISVLHPSQILEKNADLDEKLDPKTYGLIAATQSGKRGLLLPDIEGINTWQQQLDICRQKGNILNSEEVYQERFQVDKILERK